MCGPAPHPFLAHLSTGSCPRAAESILASNAFTHSTSSSASSPGTSPASSSPCKPAARSCKRARLARIRVRRVRGILLWCWVAGLLVEFDYSLNACASIPGWVLTRNAPRLNAEILARSQAKEKMINTPRAGDMSPGKEIERLEDQLRRFHIRHPNYTGVLRTTNMTFRACTRGMWSGYGWELTDFEESRILNGNDQQRVDGFLSLLRAQCITRVEIVPGMGIIEVVSNP
jgi:hypothetical protein